jgi:AraC-like DNA-binding protein
MPDILQAVDYHAGHSFYIGVFQDNFEKGGWHYHLDYELSFITEGSGKRMVGDSIEEFTPGDLIFIGPRLPHVWIADKPFSGMVSGRTLESVYMLFNQTVVPDKLLQLAEFSPVRRALRLSERGIKITGNTLNEVSEIMLQLPYLDRFTRILNFYRIMQLIGESDNLSLLASEDYIKTRFEPKNRRISAIHEYLMKNYREEINLHNLALLVHLSPGSLCRYFKSITGLTVIEYLNKIKVEYACRLLRSENLSITDISYDCGFRNLSHFNKQFKKITGKTPSAYRKTIILN